MQTDVSSSHLNTSGFSNIGRTRLRAAVAVGTATAGTGGTATNGNYVITKTGADTFTLTDINTGTITGTGGCTYVPAQSFGNSPWVTSFDTAAVTAGANVLQLLFPGEGVLCHVGTYCQLSNMTGITIFYG